MISRLYGLPVEIRSAVDLEIGDVFSLNGEVLEVLELSDEIVRIGPRGGRRSWWVPRRVDLEDEGPTFVIRPRAPAPWPSGRDRVIGGERFVATLRRIGRRADDGLV